MKAKRILIPLLLTSCMFSFAACGGKPDNGSAEAEFIATFDKHDSFVDNQVLVILTEEVSFNNIFHDYTAEDFSGIGAVDVEEIDGATSDASGLTYRIRQCLLEDSSGNTIPEYLKHYKRSFCITLDQKDADNVLHAIYVLKQRPEIYLADPNWIASGDV